MQFQLGLVFTFTLGIRRYRGIKVVVEALDLVPIVSRVAFLVSPHCSSRD